MSLLPAAAAVDRPQPRLVGGQSVRIGARVEQHPCGSRITAEEGGEVKLGETVIGRGARQVGDSASASSTRELRPRAAASKMSSGRPSESASAASRSPR